MKKHTEKLIAPIIITVLIVLFFVYYIGSVIVLTWVPLVLRIMLIVFPSAFIILAIYMLYERIQEIKGGEEDDISKY